MVLCLDGACLNMNVTNTSNPGSLDWKLQNRCVFYGPSPNLALLTKYIGAAGLDFGPRIKEYLTYLPLCRLRLDQVVFVFCYRYFV
jgi:hypothetical protein